LHCPGFCAGHTLAGMEQLPPLIGSPKQVAWAKTVRARLLALIDAHERDIEANVAKRDAKEQRSLRFHLSDQRRAFAWVRRQNVAAWWIDRRSADVTTLAAEGLQGARR
jgi:hypothetical protein